MKLAKLLLAGVLGVSLVSCATAAPMTPVPTPAATPSPMPRVTPSATPSPVMTPADAPRPSVTPSPAEPTPVRAPVAVTGNTGPCFDAGGGYHCPSTEASDERVAGSVDVVNSCEFWPNGNGADCSGTTTITNDRGTWTGEYAGTTSWSAEDPEHHHVLDNVLVGTGDYEGLRFVYRLTGGDSFPWNMTGTIEPIDN